MGKGLRETLRVKTLILDGAFGTYIEDKIGREKLTDMASGCMERLSVAFPEAVSGIHADYLEAGADAVETNTFGGNALKLGEYGLARDAYGINMESTRLARKQAERFSTGKWPRFVIGTMGPTGKLPSSSDISIGALTYAELVGIFRDQAAAIIDGGADAILIETGQDLLEMKAAVNGARQALKEKRKDLPVMAHATLSNNGRMLLGSDVSAFMGVMGSLGVDVVGLNCSTGPAEMEGAIRLLSSYAPCFVSCVPNAGMPAEDRGRLVYPMSPSEMAGIMVRLAEKYRIDLIGGCCGTTPGHIEAVRAELGKYAKREFFTGHFCASSYRGFDLATMPRPVRIGERMNTQGSRKMKSLVENDDHDGIVELAKTQERAGAHLLDLCVALTSRSTEREDAALLVRRLAESVEVPLVIDTTDVDVMKQALECYPGTAVINSANLEDGGIKAGKVFSLAREHGAFVLCLAIDEKGMAKTAKRKMEIVDRLYRMAGKDYGLSPGRLVFDLLTFTLGTGEKEYQGSAVETIKAVGMLKKKYPGVFSVLGVSNVSFGFSRPSRKVLNMAFLGAAVEAGLDMAIVDPSEYIPAGDLDRHERKLAEDLVFNRSPEALNLFMDYFSAKDPSKENAPPPERSIPEDIPIEERISRCVISRDSSRIIPLVKEALAVVPAEKIINEILMGTMERVGEKLDKGEMVLPYVLQAAEVMSRALEYLEKHIKPGDARKRGKIILATVEGDVHDIGKNLVKMILANNGFDVTDLGKQVTVERILDQARKIKPDAVGLSALLVSTSRHMKRCVEAMDRAGLEYPIVVGGAPVNESFAIDIAKLDGGRVYGGGVFYSRDAFAGLNIMKMLVEEGKKEELLRQYRERCAVESGETDSVPRTSGMPDVRVKKPSLETTPEPPFYGVRSLSNIPADEVFQHIDKKMLFELSWGSNVKDIGERTRLIGDEYETVFAELKEEALRKGWLDMKAVYGYFRCGVEGRKMKVLAPDKKVLATIDFPDVPGGRPLSDHFYPYDLVAFQAVTVGGEITKAVGALSDSGQNAKAFYLHGLGVNLAEALASYVHFRICRELGLPEGSGKRYSPGYPVWKDLKDQKKIFQLLEITDRIGIELTEDHQMIPEQSTTAIVVCSAASGS